MSLSPLAADRSLRSLDADGRLHVEATNISKANVCPYLGREIPGADSLGLDPARVYMLYRDPAELAAAAPSFCNLPLLIRHVPHSADVPLQDLTVGTTGSDVVFEAPYLRCSLAVWTAEAIALVESGAQEQLSSSYRYRADMTPGVADGVAYDGVMRDIIGNHVALVEVGRAGSDVVVADSTPVEFKKMRFPKIMAALAAVLGAAVKPEQLIALDAAMESDMGDDALPALDEAEKKAAEDAAMAAMGKDALSDEEKEEAYKSAAKDKKARDSAPPAKPEGGADKPGASDEKPKALTQADLDAAVTVAQDAAVARVNALHVARAAVAPFVGVVALDSADAVYAFALKQLGVDIAGVHTSAYPAMLALAGKASKPAKPALAADAAGAAATAEAFPGMKRIKLAG
jgi:uncharacterized protein